MATEPGSSATARWPGPLAFGRNARISVHGKALCRSPIATATADIRLDAPKPFSYNPPPIAGPLWFVAVVVTTNRRCPCEPVTEARTLIANHLNSIDDPPMAHHRIVSPFLSSSRTVSPSRERSAVGVSTASLTGCLLLLTLVVGCQTTGGDKYTFRNMPPELLAVRRENVQTLDLTRLARASANSDVIDRGDVIEVAISAGLDEKDTVRLPVRVNDAGIAHLPEIGPVTLAGLETEAAEAVIVAACVDRQLYRRPNVTVTMKRQRVNRVTVMGAVKNPDVYELPRGRSDLLAAIVAAGGLEKDAGTIVEIRNPERPTGSRPEPIAAGELPGVDTIGLKSGSTDFAATDALATGTGTSGQMQTIRVDLVSATKTGTGGYLVSDGGVVRIEKRDPEPLHVMGLVRKPDRYDFPIAEDVRVTDAIAMAGGTSQTVCNKVFVIRRKANGTDTVVIEISLREAKRNSSANLRLAPGDVVSVEQTPATVMMEALNIVRFGISGALPIPGF